MCKITYCIFGWFCYNGFTNKQTSRGVPGEWGVIVMMEITIVDQIKTAWCYGCPDLIYHVGSMCVVINPVMYDVYETLDASDINGWEWNESHNVIHIYGNMVNLVK